LGAWVIEYQSALKRKSKKTSASHLGAGQKSSRPSKKIYGGKECSAGFKPAVSRISNPQIADNPVVLGFNTVCRMEFGDTAGWETCATAQIAPSSVGLT
jgi:hypothetical protein